jgi:elongation factor P hydroxylase
MISALNYSESDDFELVNVTKNSNSYNLCEHVGFCTLMSISNMTTTSNTEYELFSEKVQISLIKILEDGDFGCSSYKFSCCKPELWSISAN